MWAPYRRYLQKKLAPLPERRTAAAAEAGRQFFEVAFPAYAPTMVRQFSKLRDDKQIRQLRAEILRASTKGEMLDSRYPQRVLQEVLRVEQKLNQIRRISGWVATALGMIPVPGLGLAAAAISEGIGAVVEKKKQAPWRWFYLISDGRGAT